MNRIKSYAPLFTKTQSITKRKLATITERINYNGHNLNHLLERNKAWAQNKQIFNPKLFPSLAVAQAPKILWIGCSDSRVPETEIFGAEPGDFFVHRNVANLAREDDINLDAALEYAVEALKVNHIIICGHYGCGGVKAALDGCPFHSVNRWISPLIKTLEDDRPELKKMSEEEAWRNAVRYGVLHSANIIKNHPALQDHFHDVQVHPWVYDIATGLVSHVSDHKNVIEAASPYQFTNDSRS